MMSTSLFCFTLYPAAHHPVTLAEVRRFSGRETWTIFCTRRPLYSRNPNASMMKFVVSSQRQYIFHRRLPRANRNVSKCSSNYPQMDEPLSHEDESCFTDDTKSFDFPKHKTKVFKNRYLNIVRFGSFLSEVAESFFKSEIRRRLFVTAVLLLISRVGYFVPLPGFDRRIIPDSYLNFTSRSVEKLGELALEIKLSFFQLGISHQMAASVVMQFLCYVIPFFVRLRKESLDAHERIKKYIWYGSLGFAVLEALVLACNSLPYSIYAATNGTRHVMVTSFIMVLGAMTMSWISDKISEFGFGQGSSLIICVGILTGYAGTLYKMCSQLSGNALSFWAYILAVTFVFIVVAMWAVVMTEGCRKVGLQYYGFKFDSNTRNGSSIQEVDPYIPFNINPSGMQPVLTTTYVLSTPGIIASVVNSPFWERVKNVLNPENSIGAAPWVYYVVFTFFVFVFNIFDIGNIPKEISDHLNKIGARIPRIKPGKATVKYLSNIQASTRFWGGILLSILATTSALVDHYLSGINGGHAVGLTSILIIVGSIIELRRSYQAYTVMPRLSKALRRYDLLQ